MRIRDRFDRTKRTPSTRTQRIGFAFFWLIVLCYAFFVASDANWNTESHLYPAVSIVDHATVNIDLYQQRLGDKALWRGHYYSDKAPGLSLLAIPVYGALRLIMPAQKVQPYDVYSHMRYSIPRSTIYLRYAITYILVVLPSALFAVLLWLFLSRFVSAGWALFSAGTYALGTIAYPFSVRFYSHQVAAIFLFSAFMLSFACIRARAPDRRAILMAALAGSLCGAAVIAEYPTAVIALMLAAYAAYVARGKLRVLGGFCAGLLPPALACGTYNLLAFGGPFATGYMHTHSAMYRSNVHSGPLGLANPFSYGMSRPSLDALWQITFGSYRGIFLVSPVLLLFASGIASMWRRREFRAELCLCVAVVVGYFLLDASRAAIVNGWSGGNSVASRHLVPVIPFMILPIVFVLRDSLLRRMYVILSAVSIALMFMTVSTIGIYSATERNPLVHEVFPRFFTGKMEVNWGFMIGAGGTYSLLPFALVATGLLGRIVWLLRSRTKPLIAPEHVIANLELRRDGRVA